MYITFKDMFQNKEEREVILTVEEFAELLDAKCMLQAIKVAVENEYVTVTGIQRMLRQGEDEGKGE